MTPIVINSSTPEGKLWDNCPNVTYKMDDGVPTVTFKNANIKFELDDNSGIYFDFDAGTKICIEIKGNNEIHAVMSVTDNLAVNIIEIKNENDPVCICGDSMKDTLTITTQTKLKEDGTGLQTNVYLNGNLEIKDCTIRSILGPEVDTYAASFRSFCTFNVNTIDCKRSRLYFSVGDINDSHKFNAFYSQQSRITSSVSDSVIVVSTSDKIAIDSIFMELNQFITFNCCKLDIKMSKGTLFLEVATQDQMVTFDNFKWIEVYNDTTGEPAITKTYDGTPYKLPTEVKKAVKIVVNSNVKEPTDSADDSLAITTTIVASVLLAMFAIIIVLLRRRRYDED